MSNENNFLGSYGLPWKLVQFVLFGFRTRWTLHLNRSVSSHSYGYASSTDQSTCFAQHALIPEPFMKYAG